MTTTDELREAVARQLCEAAGHAWPNRLAASYWRREADRIIRLVVDACAREAEVEHEFRRASDGTVFMKAPLPSALAIAAAIRALAPKEPAP